MNIPALQSKSTTMQSNVELVIDGYVRNLDWTGRPAKWGGEVGPGKNQNLPPPKINK